MITTKIYLSGKITGDLDYQKKFLNAAMDLLKAGYTGIENPCYYASEEDGWSVAMRKVLGVMLTCDGVALLPDWEDSRGAKIEARLARELGLIVKPVAAWIAEGGDGKAEIL